MDSALKNIKELPQLQMAWPKHLLHKPPIVKLPTGYSLRTYRPGDESRFYEIMKLAGWADWSDEKLAPWLSRILPEGWFMIIHNLSGKIVTTAMCTHNYKEKNPFQGELGWLACDPEHIGFGLGLAVSAAVTTRFIEAGYANIRLYSEDFRLPALKIYLRLGYEPILTEPGMSKRWKNIFEQLGWGIVPTKR